MTDCEHLFRFVRKMFSHGNLQHQCFPRSWSETNQETKCAFPLTFKPGSKHRDNDILPVAQRDTPSFPLKPHFHLMTISR